MCDFYYKKSFVKIFKENGERVVEVFARVDNKRVIASVVMEKLAPTLREIEKSGVKVLIKGEAKETKNHKRYAKGWDYCNYFFNLFYLTIWGLGLVLNFPIYFKLLKFIPSFQIYFPSFFLPFGGRYFGGKLKGLNWGFKFFGTNFNPRGIIGKLG